MRTLRLPSVSTADLTMLVSQLTTIFREIETASHQERFVPIAQDFTVTNVTPTRTLDAATATVADIANVLGTLIQDMQNGGAKTT